VRSSGGKARAPVWSWMLTLAGYCGCRSNDDLRTVWSYTNEIVSVGMTESGLALTRPDREEIAHRLSAPSGESRRSPFGEVNHYEKTK